MKKIKTDTTYIKIPLWGVIFFLTLLTITSFFAGVSLIKGDKTTSNAPSTSKNVFAAKETDKPELKFFVMSFCPYGNQIEDVLRPVYENFGDKANIKPQYIFDKIVGGLPTYCKSRSGDSSKCDSYVKSGYSKTVAECKTVIDNNYKTCVDEKNYLKLGENVYTALHGRQEATQNVREICAWNQTENNRKMWWDFIDNVNKACTSENADACWETQAKLAGLDTQKITECFNTQAGELIEKEIAITNEFQVQGSPTVLINDVIFPPESAYSQDGQGSLKVGKKVISQADFRTPNGVKEAVCASFDKAPSKECAATLEMAQANAQAPAAGACN